MDQQRPQLGRRGSLGGRPSGLVRSPSSSLLSAQMPAASLVSTPHALYSRPPPQHLSGMRLAALDARGGGRPMPLPTRGQPEVTAGAWAGATKTTLQWAIRAGDKDLIRQERARLARLGIQPDEEEEQSSDESDLKPVVARGYHFPPSNNFRRTSLATYDGSNHGYPAEPPRGRPSARPASPSPGFRPPSPGLTYGRSSARPPSPLRQLPPAVSLVGRSGSMGGLGALRSASRDRTGGPGSTPGAMGGKFGGMGALSMGQPPPRRPPSPARPSSGSPITVRGFDVPGTSPSLRPPSPVGKRFGFGSPSIGDVSSLRVARGRAGSISGFGGGPGSPPTPEDEMRASFDIQQLGSRRRLSTEERRAIELRIARGYRSP